MDGAAINSKAPNRAAGSVRRLFRAAAAVPIAVFILAAPAAPQIFGVKLVLFRPWTMYSGVGVGLLKGDFTVSRMDGQAEMLSPRQVLAMERYPLVLRHGQPHQVMRAEDLTKVVAEFCSTLAAGDQLSFDGWFATSRGWQRLQAGDVCGGLD